MKRKCLVSTAQTACMLLFALCLCAVPPLHAQTYWNGTAVKDWTGTGTESDPILISTPEQLAGLADTVNSGDPLSGKHIRLTADIWLTDTAVAKDLRPEWDAIGHRVMHGIGETQDTAVFSGHFDGAGHAVHFLYTGSVDGFSGWDDPDDPTFEGTIDGAAWYKALFGYVSEEATIRNLHLKETAITGSADVAGLVLYNRGTIEDCSMEGIVFGGGSVGSNGGGLVYENHGTIARCTVHGKSQAARNVGMIAGYNTATGVIRNCYTKGYLRATQYDAGGVVGVNAGLVENCGADVQTSKSAYNYGSGPDCGGFVGRNAGTIRNCYALGNVIGAYQHGGGGFVGTNTGRIEACYATGDCYGGYGCQTGAFVGTNGYYDFYMGWSDFTPGIIINCFATGRNYYDDTLEGTGFCQSQNSNSGSLMVNCYYITNHGIDVSNNNAYIGGAELRDSSMLQTQAFVDTLNMVAAWTGTSTWQYNESGYPTSTGQVSTNITDYCEGGDGSETNPYRISSKEHLLNFAAMVNKGYDFREQHILQTADIVLNRPMSEWGEEMPTVWRPIGDIANGYQHDFRGNYNGGFHEVRNLYLNNFNDGQGFFGCLNHGAVVRNLGITDVWMKAKGSVGIVAGFSSRYAANVIISQCWTSGQAEGEWAAGGILGDIALEGKTDILNCRSSANLTAVNYAAAVVGDQNYIGGSSYSNDTIGNFLFTGTLKATAYQRPMRVLPMSGMEWHFNGYYDNEVLPVYTADQEKERHDYCAATTAWLQGTEVVNIYNAWVDEYNRTHTFQLDYWQQNADGYPSVSPAFIPPHTVRFVSNGGGDYTDIHALDSSLVPMPKNPAKEGMTFGGWYGDEACTQLFVFDTARVVSDTTLYAKWLPIPSYDISIFQNPFATSYTIRTVEQLYGFSVAVNGLEGVIDPMTFEGKTVRLANDLTVNDPVHWQQWGKSATAVPFTPVGQYRSQFLGTFDGQGHTITGLYTNGAWTGLFGYIGVGGIVKNVHIRQSVLEVLAADPGSCHGLLASVCRGTVEHCTVQGRVIGSFYKGTGASDVGGLIGNVGGYYAGESGGKVAWCSADVEVLGYYTTGGLIGKYNSSDTIQYCYTKGTVSGFTAGGICGSGAKMANCYSIADVNVYKGSAGGLMNGSAAAKNCYYAGTVRIADVVTDGATSSSSSELTNVYYLSHDAPRTNGRYGTPLTDLQMHAKTSYTDYDFDNVWGRKDTINGGYPYLRWQYGDYILDDPDAEYVAVTGITLDVTTKEILTNDTCRLTATIQPADATNRKVLWKSSNESVATVDTAGLVTALSAGKTTIMAQTQEGLKTARCTLTVVQPVLGIKWYSDIITLGKTQQMKAVFTPDSLTRPVQWNSSNPEVASIDSSGLVTALSVGNTYISVQTLDGSLVSEEKKIYVVWYPVTGVTLSGVSTIAVGQSAALSISITPYNASNRNVTWASSDERILSVSNGRITGVSPGTAIVTVTTEDGGFTAQKEITVTGISVTGVSISGVSKVGIGETVTLTALVSPTNASNRHATWTSSDETILTVDDDGNLTGVAFGTATVTVTTDDGGYTASQEIEVIRVAVTGVRLNGVPTLRVGEKYQMEAAIQPANATDKRLLWSSDNESVLRVDSTGMLTALAESRRVTVTVTTVEGNYTASRTIRISGFMYTLTDFAIAPADTVLSQGDTLTLTALVTPAEATEFTAFTWQSSDSEVVSVDNGVARALATGEVTVTATATFAETTLEATCRITCHPSTALQTPADASAPARKVLIDNVLYILLPDGHMYDMMGQKGK